MVSYEDDWLNDSLVIYIKKNVDNEKIFSTYKILKGEIVNLFKK